MKRFDSLSLSLAFRVFAFRLMSAVMEWTSFHKKQHDCKPGPLIKLWDDQII